MKSFLALFLIIGSFSSFAYTNWSNYTPYHIFSKVSLVSGIQKKIIIQTKGFVNSCSGLFENNKFQVKVISCSGGKLDLKVQYKNKVNCDQGMSYTKKLKVKLEKECFENFAGSYPGESVIIINGQRFEDH